VVRPTQDRVREALFSSLGERVVGARVLDLFAGTGALGLEAYSRGARSVTWVEQDAQAFRLLRANVQELCGDDPALRLVQRDVYRYLGQGTAERGLDLVLADPPYQAGREGGGTEKLLRLLGAGSILQPTGYFVMEQGKDQAVPEPDGWTLARNKAYGKTRLLMYIRGFPAPTGDHSP
jgi:16S rRNA (guanine966-N2)-methyltransferase